MCGIVGILGRKPVAPLILDALKRLEYRGYDSAGIATLEGGHLTRCRAEGKLVKLEEKLAREPLAGLIGIGHTRWATHGVPTECNAHPHATARLAVVHNGIIENFRELRAELVSGGAVFTSQTDTEVIAHLVDHYLSKGLLPKEAVEAALKRLVGAFALAIIFEGQDNIMIVARRGSPLAIGHGDGEMYVGSDAIALGPFTNRLTYLDEGDMAVITREGVMIYVDGVLVHRPIVIVDASSLVMDKRGHRHFMAKEIHEQPEVVGYTLAHYLKFADSTAVMPEGISIDWTKYDRIRATACGTAFYALRVAKSWFGKYAKITLDVEVGSEFRYDEAPFQENGLCLMVSQSGETADTLASLRYAKANGQRVAAILNVKTSTMAREADFVLPTLAGPEFGVASTKAFTCQLAVLASLVIVAGRARGVLSAADEMELVEALSNVPRLMNQVLQKSEEIRVKVLPVINGSNSMYYMGRGTNYPLACEGALKIKEIAYIHAEGYAAGELKHGPIALVDKHMPLVVLAPFDRLFEKTVSNMQEVAARGGKFIFITDERGVAAASVGSAATIVLPDMHPIAAPIVSAIPMQFIAYHAAVAKGTDVDQPRNLAKSVTVE